MQPPVLYSARGERLALGPELARGGQGAVYALPQHPQRVAKVYLSPPPAEQGEKLRWMAAHPPPAVERLAAWPLEVLHEGQPGGPVRGFLMVRLDGFKPIHLLYSTASRRKEFPRADWSFLVHTALNCASAFEELHAAGHRVGDINESNLLVSPKDATVRFIDCDSFQIHAAGRVYGCEVGVPLFTPPELQGRSLRGLERTLAHEGFGLAVLVFHLLFLGRHPFTGIFSGAGDMTPERAIRELRFAYGRDARVRQMAPPAIHLPLSTLPPELGELFERAFAPESVQRGRPDARQWHQALQQLVRSLRTCPQEPAHKYPQHLASCPWCGLLAARGVAFFSSPPGTVQGAVQSFACTAQEIEGLWSEVQRLLGPSLATPVVVGSGLTPPERLPAEVQAEVDLVRRSSLAMVCGAVLVALGWWVLLLASARLGTVLLAPAFTLLGGATALWWKGRKEMKLPALAAERLEALGQAQAALAQARAEYERFREDSGRRADRAREHLHALRAEFVRLEPEYEAERRRLLQGREAHQRELYLRGALIEDEEFEGIKSVLKANLVRWGIESAYDVLKGGVEQVPGFGKARTARLEAWARKVERGFRFDPTQAVSEAERRALVSSFQQRKAAARARLEAELEPLRAWSQEQVRRAAELAGRVEAAQQAVARAAQALPAAEPVMAAALQPAPWEDRRLWLGLATVGGLGSVAALVLRLVASG